MMTKIFTVITVIVVQEQGHIRQINVTKENRANNNKLFLHHPLFDLNVKLLL